MSLPAVVSEAAEADLQGAFQWYERQRQGLGERLLTHVQTTLDQISEHPIAFPKVHLDTRRALVHRFPYAVLFVVESTFVDIIAIMHTHRDPLRWQARAR